MNTELPDENNSKHCNFKKRKRILEREGLLYAKT